MQKSKKVNNSVSIKEIAKMIASKISMPYCWEDIENRLKMGMPMPSKLKD